MSAVEVLEKLDQLRIEWVVHQVESEDGGDSLPTGGGVSRSNRRAC